MSETKESTFEHKFRVGQNILYPENSRLKKGKIDEVHFYKQEIRGIGEVKYLVVPQGKSKRQGTVREEDDIISR